MDVLHVRGDRETRVSRITPDSRTAGPGSLFVAVRGHVTDGHDWISHAVQAGAGVVVAESEPTTGIPDSVVWVRVTDSRQALAALAGAWYDHPSASLKLVGVTGTNGKTSVVFTLYQMFTFLGYACGLISTVKNIWPGHEETARLTTPDVLSLQGLLASMVEAGCDYVFMEVSSHAADQGRTEGLHFAGGIFTNITHDHLDYHGTFPAYLKAKKRFFDGLSEDAFALINRDDRNGMVMVQNCMARTATFGLQHTADFQGRILEDRLEGLVLRIEGKTVSTRLIGAFNASNLLAAYGAACLLGIDHEQAMTALSACQPVEGRMDVVHDPGGRIGVVDFAHTPDALEKVLNTLQKVRPISSRLIVVIGCGGDRDAAKRPLMGAAAAKGADLAVFTADNPRSEDPDVIIRQMLEGVPPDDRSKVQPVTFREQAIQVAIRWARPGDVILLAGKGHEKYQEIKGVRTPFDDKQRLKEAFEQYKVPV